MPTLCLGEHGDVDVVVVFIPMVGGDHFVDPEPLFEIAEKCVEVGLPSGFFVLRKRKHEVVGEVFCTSTVEGEDFIRNSRCGRVNEVIEDDPAVGGFTEQVFYQSLHIGSRGAAGTVLIVLRFVDMLQNRHGSVFSHQGSPDFP